ncbi:MAG: SRPBCC domain-containing protein [Marinifilaceae bacterium]|jgi:activator of HSP90 ATPase|nr:SRPBCC domain-containing protein [Marinifilaceae bacterium]
MKDFNFEIDITASQEEVYNALTNPYQLEYWTGCEAQMQTKAGTEFSLWEGDICGMNIEFVENYKIVQEWFFGETSEASIVSLVLKKKKKDLTCVKLTHTNIPDEAYDEIVEGWEEYYLGAVKRYLEFY